MLLNFLQIYILSLVKYLFPAESKTVVSVLGIYNKGKILPVLKHYTIKVYARAEVKPHIFLTSALDGNEWSASHSIWCTTKETVPGTHLIGA
jgi:hypothetical protein